MSRAAELRRVIEANRIRLLTVKAWGTRLDFDCWEFTSSEPLTEAEWKRYLNPWRTRNLRSTPLPSSGAGMASDLRCGDCLDVLDEIDAESVGAVVCDPPYGLGFMGKCGTCLGSCRPPLGGPAAFRCR
mgnify:CR=1 FL=1